MKKRIAAFLKKIRLFPACLLICAVLLTAACCLPSSRAEEAADSWLIPGITDSFGYFFPWDFLYSDAFFSLPSDRYQHDLARLSFGLTTAAFRVGGNPEHQDEYLLAFLDRMGFSDPETEAYRTPPTGDSICHGFARKTIGDIGRGVHLVVASPKGSGGPNGNGRLMLIQLACREKPDMSPDRRPQTVLFIYNGAITCKRRS